MQMGAMGTIHVSKLTGVMDFDSSTWDFCHTAIADFMIPLLTPTFRFHVGTWRKVGKNVDKYVENLSEYEKDRSGKIFFKHYRERSFLQLA